MIITLSGANFSSSNIGNLGNSGPFDVTVSCSNVSGASVSLNGGGKSASGTGSAKLTAVPSGTSVTYTISASGYNTASGTINVSFSNVTRSISLTAVGSVTPPVNPDQPGTGGGSGETPSTTTWYVDHRNNGSLLTTAVNIAGRGWCHEVNTPAYNAYVGKPVNTVSFFTKKASQSVTVMVGTTNSSEENCRLIGTYTATNPNGNSKGLATITFPTVTLNNGEHLILFAQTDSDIDFYYASKAVTDANGIVDSGFHGRVPKVYGTGTAWQKMSTSGTYSLAWSIGYVI